MKKDDQALIINEIFYSIQGESSRAGEPCVFVRLTGCGLRCVWCDTEYSFYEGVPMTIDEVMDRVATYNCKFVEITGGEPLEQALVFPLMTKLCDEKHVVFVETGGHIDISTIDKRVHRIVDLKCPGSGMEKRNLYRNMDLLTSNDEIKFVIANENDYEWAKQKVKEYDLATRCGSVLFSPVFGVLENITLSNWILRDHLPVRFQVQLHKYIWEPQTRGV
jgi:7-carboxy-7-deazaguanine synthase